MVLPLIVCFQVQGLSGKRLFRPQPKPRKVHPMRHDLTTAQGCGATLHLKSGTSSEGAAPPDVKHLCMFSGRPDVLSIMVT